MLNVLLITLLAIGAVLLNAHAAAIADRSSERRARLEDDWSQMIGARRG